MYAATEHSYSTLAGILGRNLIVARCAAGLTQAELADRALVSRATIVQIESGTADPKISTLQQISGALGVASSLLLVGIEDLAGLASLLNPDPAEKLPLRQVVQTEQLKELLSTGRVRELMQAARLALKSAQENGVDPKSLVSAAIGAVLLPARGSVVGAAWRSNNHSQPLVK